MNGQQTTDEINRVDYLSRQNDLLRAIVGIEFARQGKESETYGAWQLAAAQRVGAVPDSAESYFVHVMPMQPRTSTPMGS
jgi:hypothetical protein